jgi:hypothetical protein
VPTADRLIDLARVATSGAATAYVNGGTLKAFAQAMDKAISTAATATYLAATAQRLGLDPSSKLFAQNRLTKAERADINAVIVAQREYLKGFIADIQAGKLSPAQIAARANLYGPGTITTFYSQARWGDWDIPKNLLPGQQQCQGNCKCSISVADNGDGTGVLTRTLHAEDSCTECPPLAGDYPITRRKLS